MTSTKQRKRTLFFFHFQLHRIDWLSSSIESAYKTANNSIQQQQQQMITSVIRSVSFVFAENSNFMAKMCECVCIKWYNRNKIDQMKRRACVMVPTNQRYPFTHSESFLSFFRHIADFMKLPERPFHSPHSCSFFNFRTKEIPIYIYIWKCTDRMHHKGLSYVLCCFSMI